MKYKIVADSSANMRAFEGVAFANVPLKIITKEKEYIDDEHLDVAAMVADLKAYKGTSGSSCPNVYDWLHAFGDAENVFAVAISGSLSGSCNAARQAAEEYRTQHPDRKVCVIDSLTAGPELRLICERLRRGILAGDSFEQIEETTRAYMKHTHTLFALQSLNNLARNGRVNMAVAKLAGVLGIWVVGKGSDEGTLQQRKARGGGDLCRDEEARLCGRHRAHEQLPERQRDRYAGSLYPGGLSGCGDHLRADHGPVQLLCGAGRHDRRL